MSESSASAAVASVERRVDAVHAVLRERGMEPDAFIAQANHSVEERSVPDTADAAFVHVGVFESDLERAA